MNGSPDGGVAIPPEFWRSLSEKESMEVVTRGYFDMGQCVRLWEMLGRKDVPPPSLQLMVRREDVMRLWPKRGEKW